MPTKNKSKTVSKTQPAKSPIEDKYELILTSEIDFSPLNYRKVYSESGLQELAASISIHGIIENLTVRPMPSGRYELVTGERRLRAAILNSLLRVPVTIKNLTDDEVREIQLVENIQSEDPHPMHEALAIGYMQQNRKSINEIAARLGKSKAFIYSRIKLSSLIPEIQEMFQADIFTLTEALEISVLSGVTQRRFFDQFCANWQKQEHFHISSLGHFLAQFKYDLKTAPFDKKDKDLLPEIGPCTKCPFNTATLKTLFPEEAKEAVCTNGECFERKCTVHHSTMLTEVFNIEKPDALVYSWNIPEMMELACKVIPGADGLPKYDRRTISIYQTLQFPDKEDFILDYNDDGDDEPSFDEQGYNHAMEEYNSELERYNSGLLKGEVLKGLHFSDSSVGVLFFSLRSDSNECKTKVTAKEVRSALKTGTATPELLNAEIDRINDREKRAKELDRGKVQISVHHEFSGKLIEGEINLSLTGEDLTAARLLIYQSLDYSSREKVNGRLFSGEKADSHNPEFLYQLLNELTEEQYCFLIRVALSGKSESRFPNNPSSYTLYKVAGSAGINAESIENLQEQKAKERIARLNERVETLRAMIKD